MQKFIIMSFLLLSVFYRSSPQKVLPHWQPENIDSLKKILSFSKDTVRVNLLNEISYAYYNTQSDSSRWYALHAYEEASSLRYLKGVAVSLFYRSQLEMLLGNRLQAKAYAKKASEFADESRDNIVYANSIILLGLLSSNKEGLSLIEKAVTIFAGINHTEGLLDAYAAKAIIFLRLGRSYDALQLYNKYAGLGKQSNNQESIANAFNQIGRIYATVGDYNTAMDYLKQSDAHRSQFRIKSPAVYIEISDLYVNLKKYDSALYYVNRNINDIQSLIEDPFIRGRTLTLSFIKKAEVYSRLGRSDEALRILLPLLDSCKKHKNNNLKKTILPLIGEAYAAQTEYTKALQFGREAIQLALPDDNKILKRNASGLLSRVFRRLKQHDSAYYYLELSTILQETLSASNFENNMTFFKTMSQNETSNTKIELLHRDNEIKRQRLNLLLGSLLSLILIGGFIVRTVSLKRKNEANGRLMLENKLQLQKLESENKQVSLQQHAAELEMKALKSQMNPHFIFNCLNAINHFVLKNETETASDYLTRFSRLIRMVLQNSSKQLIPLADELATLQLYIELEQLRFKNHFRFIIFVEEDIDVDGWLIPPLILQPFAENAIWHGLMQKEEEGGKLTIGIGFENEMLCCTISDNGVGRQKNSVQNMEAETFKKSMGIEITNNRLNILPKAKQGAKPSLTIVDLKNSMGMATGTKVIIRLPVTTTTEMSQV